MTDTVVIADEAPQESGYRFSWGLAFAGGVAATAVTFFLLTLGSGFGLLLVDPVRHSAPAFLTGGAVYFIAAQAVGFAFGGHIAGRMLGAILESPVQEEFRAAAHGFVAWAVAVLATLTMVTFAGLTAAGTVSTTAALYGAASTRTDPAGPTAYLVDRLFRPAGSAGSATDTRAAGARVEAGRLLDVAATRNETLAADDRERLIALTAQQSGLSRDDAAARVDGLMSDVQKKTRQAAEVARKAASYVSLWIALSLLLGAFISVVTAIFARKEDDNDGLFFKLR